MTPPTDMMELPGIVVDFWHTEINDPSDDFMTAEELESAFLSEFHFAYLGE